MPKKIKVASEVLDAALKAAGTAKTADELRMAQSVILPILLGASDEAVGRLMGRCRVSVVRLRKQFKQMHRSGKPKGARNWGGRRNEFMSQQEERRFVCGFLDRAREGGMLVVADIKQALEALVGKKVAKTTIYRMLDRHGWRKIVPRPHHPQTDPRAQEGFKKTSKAGEPVC